MELAETALRRRRRRRPFGCRRHARHGQRRRRARRRRARTSSRAGPRRPRALRGETGGPQPGAAVHRRAVPGRRAPGVAAAAGRRRAGRGHDAAWTPSRSSTSRTGRTGRHELLIRLRDGLEPAPGPAEFLPAAERTDLVLRLDRWVLERAVAGAGHAAGAARRASARGQRLGALAGDPDLGRLDPRAAQGGRGRAGAARAGDHRDRRRSAASTPRASSRGAHRGGLRLRARRLRRGLRLVLLPQVPAVHHGQDRGRVRAAGRRPTPSTAR